VYGYPANRDLILRRSLMCLFIYCFTKVIRTGIVIKPICLQVQDLTDWIVVQLDWVVFKIQRDHVKNVGDRSYRSTGDCNPTYKLKIYQSNFYVKNILKNPKQL
jgi:hypothetical protein